MQDSNMEDLDYIKLRWTSIIDELIYEKETIEFALKSDANISDIVSRKAIKAMSKAEIEQFYDSTIQASTIFGTIELFIWLENFIFKDLEKRRNNGQDSICSILHGLGKYKNNIGKLLEAWKSNIDDEYKETFTYLDDIRRYRNWIAHGKRSKLITKKIHNFEESYAIIDTVQKVISNHQ